MDIDRLLIDLSVMSQLKEQDKLGVMKLPGKQQLVIYSGRHWFQGAYRWYYGSSRTEVMEFLQSTVNCVERHSDIFSEPVTEKTQVLRVQLKTYLLSAIEGLKSLEVSYLSDSHVVAKLNLISSKLLECAERIKV